MQKKYFFIFLLFLSISVKAQENEICISGIILDSENDEPIPFAKIFSFHEDATLTGIAQSDFDGLFSFKCNQSSIGPIKVKAHGYIDLDTLINTKSNSKKITIRLKVKPLTLNDSIINKIYKKDLYNRVRNQQVVTRYEYAITSIEGECSFGFPEEPELDTLTLRNDTTYHYISNKDYELIFEVVWRKRNLNETYESAYRYHWAGLQYALGATANGYKITNEKGYKAMTFDAHSKNETIYYLIVLSNTHYYCITVINETEKDVSKAKDAFFNSFKLITTK